MFRRTLRRIRRRFERISATKGGVECPVCGHRIRQFRPFGDPVRKNAQCPQCGALERHRFAWLIFTQKTDLFDGGPKRVLHIAPESCFEPRLKTLLDDGYLTADLTKPEVMMRMDITDIRLPEAHFDAIICSHVLEHIPEDSKALCELFRVLKSGGWAFLDVPITADRTFEDPTIDSPESRKLTFGQDDHVRRCGLDYGERMEQAGFKVEILTAVDLLGEAEVIRFGIQPKALTTFLAFKNLGSSQ